MNNPGSWLISGALLALVGCGTTETGEAVGTDASSTIDTSGSGSGVDVGSGVDPDGSVAADTEPAADVLAPDASVDSVTPPSSCEGENPQGCSSDADCAEGDSCQVVVTGQCIPSSCGCDVETGAWICTDDCGNMRCAPDRIACRPTGTCPDGQECIDGWCSEPPVDCPTVEAPVCGEDGETYGNACLAEAAGATVAYEGRCRADGDCGADTDCELGSICEAGACEIVGCERIYAPVCGADGRTYANACVARTAHVEVAAEGECETDPCAAIECDPGKVCVDGSCIGEVMCDVDCERPDPVCGVDGMTYECGRAEAECNGVDVAYAGPCIDRDPCATIRCRAGFVCRDGECVEDTCTIACLIPDPVCGTDGRTYGCGAVEAECYGVDVAYEGECRPNPDRCRSNDDCAVGSLCFSGTCEVAICPAVYRPVCGADGRTYGNSCLADAAHVEVVADEACGSRE